MNDAQSFQQQYFPDGECFGCGHANHHGLQVASYVADDGRMVCEWTPRPEHSNGAGAVCGGILGSILDCHAAAATAHALTEQHGEYMFGVTKEFTVQFLRPTPMAPLRLVARATEVRTRSVAIEATAEAGGEICCRFTGVFVVPRNWDQETSVS